jgi:hypothetical protein
MKSLRIMLIMILLIYSLMAAEGDKLNTIALLTEKQIHEEIDDAIDNLAVFTEFEPGPYGCPGGPHIVAGNAVVWISHNFIKPDGWQITGYSWLRNDSKFRKSRLKIGLIGGELEAMRSIYDPYLRDLYDDDLGFKPGIVVGIHFWKEF